MLTPEPKVSTPPTPGIATPTTPTVEAHRKPIVKPPKKRKGSEYETDLGSVLQQQQQHLLLQQQSQRPYPLVPLTPTQLTTSAPPTPTQAPPTPTQVPPTLAHAPPTPTQTHPPVALSAPTVAAAHSSPYLFAHTMAAAAYGHHQGAIHLSQAPVIPSSPLPRYPPTSAPVAAAASPTPLQNKKPLIDLHDWKGHRVLAKRDNAYLPAVIKVVQGNCHLGIQFDGDKNNTYFNNILDSRVCPDVISDHSPLALMVQVGMAVCVRINPDDQVFYSGRIVEKRGTPVAYRVELDRDGGADGGVLVTRANLRLLQAPWHEDLEEEEIMTITSRAQQVCT